MSGRWFRVYESLAHDPKVQRLPAEMFRGMINLWCLASSNEGIIPPPTDIAFVLRMTPAKAVALVEGLLAAGLIDVGDDGHCRPHNWKGRQFNSDVSTKRVKRFRERQKAVSGNADETFPETALDQSRTEQTKPEKKDAGTSPAIVKNGEAPTTPETELFQRGKVILGKSAGGQISKLLKAKDGNVALARAVIETASTKQNPGEYIGAILRNHDPPDKRGLWDGIV